MKPVPAMCALLLAATLLVAAYAETADYSVAGIDNPQSVEDFAARLRDAVYRGDRSAVAAMVSYPIRVTLDGRARSIKNADAFVANYDAIMTQPVKDAVVRQDPKTLFVNSQGVMFGAGEVWFSQVGRQLRVITINN